MLTIIKHKQDGVIEQVIGENFSIGALHLFTKPKRVGNNLWHKARVGEGG